MDNQQRNPNLWDIIIEEYKQGESMNKLSQKYNKNIGQIRYKIAKSGTKIRNVKKSVRDFFYKEPINISNSLKEMILGMILGDGGMRLAIKGKYPHFIYTDKHREVLEYIIPFFLNEGIKCSEIYKGVNAYTFQTETRPEFMDIYNLFYPKEIMITQKQFRKILPDINLTPTMLLWWYIGDGSSSKQSKSWNNRGQISCKYYNEYVLKQLQKITGNQVKFYSYKKGGTYHLGNKGLILLLDYIGDCPIECYDYKWITRRSETIMEES